MILSIEVADKNEAVEAIALLQAYVGADNPSPKAEAPKAPKAKAVKAKPAKVEAPVEDEDDKEDEASAEFTIDDVREKAKELINSGNRDAVKEILEDLGVDRVTKLTVEQYGQFIGAANDIA